MSTAQVSGKGWVAAIALAGALLGAIPAPAQSSRTELVQVQPPMQQIESPDASLSAADLEKRGDQFRANKAYFDAVDYYRAALAKNPQSATLYNKIGITELVSQHLRDAEKNFERALKIDRGFADAYNNLGVVEYLRHKDGKAVKYYQRAIAARPDTASYFSNMGTAYFAKKEWKKCIEAYSHAVELDPEVFQSASVIGVSGEISAPKDRARFSYFLARLYAKQGLDDLSLEYLRRAMEAGYKGIGEVYQDAEFTQLRKDPRFVQLMASPPVSVPE
jgi:tetratricopeptide (TPR) repeat protein